MEDRDVDELHRIWQLKEKGAISDEEYLRLKAKILDKESASPGSQSAGSQPKPPIATALQSQSAPRSQAKAIGYGCLGLLALVFVIGLIGSNTKQPSSSSSNAAGTIDDNLAAASPTAEEAPSTAWTYSQDEDKVRGGTTYYARTTSTNSISQSFPYDSNTTMDVTVRKSPAYGTDVILTISSGQMMCPSYEGCNGTVRFDSGPAQRVSFNGPADSSSDTVFVEGPKQFITKLKKAKKITIEKTLYEAGNPQFEFDVHGLKWDH